MIGRAHKWCIPFHLALNRSITIEMIEFGNFKVDWNTQVTLLHSDLIMVTSILI